MRRSPFPPVFAALAFSAWLLAPSAALAQAAAPGPRPDEQFDVMNVLTRAGLHDIENESWNMYGQFTYISSWKLPFHAPYTNLNGSTNSLLPGAERSFTGTATVSFGVKLWHGAEAYFVPEVISERPLSQLKGLGGAIQNFELQKGGAPTPQLYRSRTYLRQTVGLGGERVAVASNPQQLGTVYDRRRLVLTLGNFTILDVLDKNALGVDPRKGFFSLGLMTYGAYDFASDARGYSWGGVAELYWDDWVVRFGRLTPPRDPNQLAIDFRLDRYYGDQVELEHAHRIAGRDGRVRVLAYRNRENTGRFDEALAVFQADPTKNATSCPGFNYGSGNAGAPDLCWVRKPNIKVGVGLFFEQYLTPDIGVFFRGMVSDGQTEVYAYTSTDRSLSFAALGKGALWSRPADVTGVALNLGWISAAHAAYLRAGGIDGFIGDGALNPSVEASLDAFYSVQVINSVWLSADYQHLVHPGFNADRGPVEILSGKIHAEF